MFSSQDSLPALLSRALQAEHSQASHLLEFNLLVLLLGKVLPHGIGDGGLEQEELTLVPGVLQGQHRRPSAEADPQA